MSNCSWRIIAKFGADTVVFRLFWATLKKKMLNLCICSEFWTMWINRLYIQGLILLILEALENCNWFPWDFSRSHAYIWPWCPLFHWTPLRKQLLIICRNADATRKLVSSVQAKWLWSIMSLTSQEQELQRNMKLYLISHEWMAHHYFTVIIQIEVKKT